MNKDVRPTLSVVVPIYNEAAGLRRFYESLKQVLLDMDITYEIILVDDGSIDGSVEEAGSIARSDRAVRQLRLTRNFGKEAATTAGIHAARGQAVLMVDADGQHPVDTIPKLVQRWREGAKVVVGKRTARRASIAKRLSARLFYSLSRLITGVTLDPDTSDFRLIDQEVQAAFNRLTEHHRMTKALIDWLGYERTYVPYAENARIHGTAGYSFRKLFKLAVHSAVSLSISPLYISAYVGAVVLPLSVLLGVGMGVNYFLRDPIGLHATGGAYLIVLVLFLVGLLLVSQGIIGLYLSHIHAETQNRPLYVVYEPKEDLDQ